jgi:hypothetical protein
MVHVYDIVLSLMKGEQNRHRRVRNRVQHRDRYSVCPDSDMRIQSMLVVLRDFPNQTSDLLCVQYRPRCTIAYRLHMVPGAQINRHAEIGRLAPTGSTVSPYCNGTKVSFARSLGVNGPFLSLELVGPSLQLLA